MRFREIAYGSDDYKRALALRQGVLRSPLGLRLSEDDLAGEDRQLHFGLFAGDEALIACVVARPLSAAGSVKLRQMAVSAGHRGQRIGQALMGAVETRLRASGYAVAELAARSTVVGFYEKLGYAAYGEPFIQAGIEHVSMRKRL